MAIIHDGRLARVIEKPEWHGREGRLGGSSFSKPSMRKIFGIARYTFIEVLRNKIWYVLVLFSGIMILSTLLLGTLGGESRKRGLMVDLGLASIEMISFLSTVFAAVTLVLEEMRESRTIFT